MKGFTLDEGVRVELILEDSFDDTIDDWLHLFWEKAQLIRGLEVLHWILGSEQVSRCYWKAGRGGRRIVGRLV